MQPCHLKQKYYQLEQTLICLQVYARCKIHRFLRASARPQGNDAADQKDSRRRKSCKAWGNLENEMEPKQSENWDNRSRHATEGSWNKESFCRSWVGPIYLYCTVQIAPCLRMTKTQLFGGRVRFKRSPKPYCISLREVSAKYPTGIANYHINYLFGQR